MIIWAGKPECYYTALARLEAAPVRLDAGEDLPNPVGLEIEDTVAIVSVSGGTFSQTTAFTRWVGIPTYEDILERLVEAIDNSNVKVIILEIKSQGGDAKGVRTLSNKIESLSKIKPIISYTEHYQLSAACWYGAACSSSIADEEGELGSIGAILTHTSIYNMNKAAGIEVTTLRSVPDKALGGMNELLDERATKYLTSKLETIHGKFSDGIKYHRGLTQAQTDLITNGKVYDAPQALAYGLIDGIMTLDELVSKSQKRKKNASTR